MKDPRYYLAIDLGAESGRGMLGTFDGERLELEEVHRFPNGPVRLLDTMYWDFPGLFREIKTAIAKAAARSGGRIDAIGVDSWGVDYGLIGEKGQLLGNPFHYRDSRTDGAMEEVFRKVPREEVFDRTGIQFMQLNTLFQLWAHEKSDPESLRRAKKLLLIADLVNYFLTGNGVAEYTLATTTQFYDVRKNEWSRPLLEKLGIPTSLLPEVVRPGTIIGSLRPDIVSDAGLRAAPPVVAPATHDTGSAVAAVPAEGGPGWGYISSGTWSLMGIEIGSPCVTAAALAGNFTNEGGVDGTTRFLKNIMGLWLVQESRRQWAREGLDLDYEALTHMAEKAPALRSIVVPDDPSFFAPGDMPARIREYCRKSGQPEPSNEGELVRCALESLALAYRWTAEKIAEITGVRIGRLHIVGGGSRNALLDRFAASALGTPVLAGPVEATAMGNVLFQAVALKDIPDLAALRKVVRASSRPEAYEPEERAPWDRAYERFKALKARD